MAKRRDNDEPIERLMDPDISSESTMMQNMSGSREYAHDVEVGNPSTEVSPPRNAREAEDSELQRVDQMGDVDVDLD